MDILHQDLPSKRNGSFMESSVDDDFDEAFYESILEELSDSDKTNDDDELPADREPDDSNNVKSESEDFECGDYSSSMFDEGDEEDFFGDDEEDPFDMDNFPMGDDLDDGDDDPFDFDDEVEDMSPAALAGTATAIDDDTINRVVGPENPQELSPEEEMQADDMMSVAATSVVVNNELNSDEKKDFIESEREIQIAMNEGFLMESDVQDIAESADLVMENSYNKKMIVRLDKNAKLKQLYAIGINVSAAAHHDPDYYKLKKINRMRKLIKARLRKKYHSEALKRMKIYFKRLTGSKSKTLSKIGKKLGNKMK